MLICYHLRDHSYSPRSSSPTLMRSEATTLNPRTLLSNGTILFRFLFLLCKRQIYLLSYFYLLLDIKLTLTYIFVIIIIVPDKSNILITILYYENKNIYIINLICAYYSIIMYVLQLAGKITR